jgi:hypothetical protein
VYFVKVNEKTNKCINPSIFNNKYSPTCFGILECHLQGFKFDAAEIGAQCRGKQRWMEAVMVRMYNILSITPPATIYSFHPSLLPTTLGTYLSRIMFDSPMMAF